MPDDRIFVPSASNPTSPKPPTQAPDVSKKRGYSLPPSNTKPPAMPPVKPPNGK